jgi:hypothetical protein
MTNYKGIDLNKHKAMKNYIDTYYFIDKENCIECLNNDLVLQRMVKAHYRKEKAYVSLINLLPYIAITIFIIGATRNV